MKRPLHVIDPIVDPAPPAPLVLEVGASLVSVTDTGDGTASRRFADALVEAGAAELETPHDDDAALRIVIRATPRSPQARLRAEVLEESADVLLGSARSTFALRFVRES